MQCHESGEYVATHFRYPLIYGPRQPIPIEWRLMRRVLDGRRYIVLPDDGLLLLSRGYSQNMAHAVLLAVDKPKVSGGQIYNCADVKQFTLAQWAQLILNKMDAQLEVIGTPGVYPYTARDFFIGKEVMNHQLFDVYKIRSELGYADVVPPIKGLSETVKWYLDNPPDFDAEYDADLQAHYRYRRRIGIIGPHLQRRIMEG